MSVELSQLLQRHLNAENDHNLEGTLATLTKDCVFEDKATGQTWRGHAGATDHYQHWWRTFDVEVARGDGKAYWTSDGTYIAEATWKGTHIGDYLGFAATGKSIIQPFVVLITFKDGLMSGEKFYYDLASLISQLGSAPIANIDQLPFRETGS
jgi:steroid delta-isomerase-like uncharacterized protein